jgi:anti-sigma regulatory factor (Ser/Thr protein kinase)
VEATIGCTLLENRVLPHLEVPAVPQSVRTVRDEVCEILVEWRLPPGFIEKVRLLASEIATNAIQAEMDDFEVAETRPPIDVWVVLFPGVLYFVVADCASGVPKFLEPDDELDHGRGLHIIEKLGATITVEKPGGRQMVNGHADPVPKAVVSAIPLPRRRRSGAAA